VESACFQPADPAGCLDLLPSSKGGIIAVKALLFVWAVLIGLAGLGTTLPTRKTIRGAPTTAAAWAAAPIAAS
jgi:hypothetical protein